MEEFKGTKGEWKSRGYNTDSNGYIGIDFPKVSISVYGGCTDSMNDEEKQKHIEEAEANAKLIAAAPDMLNALKECMIELYSIHSQYGDKENALEHSHALTISEQAIQKALK